MGGGAVVARFEGGTVAWSPTGGSRVVQGGINAKWMSLGGPRSALGMPTSNEFDVPAGRRTTFEHGSITWRRSGGETVARTG